MSTWDNERDANNHLAGTIVRTKKGDVVYVTEVRQRDGRFRIGFVNFSRDGVRNHAYGFDALNLEPVDLGYFPGTNWFTQRTPNRRWRCGLDNGNVSVTTDGRHWERFSILSRNHSDVANLISGVYPSFEEAVKALSEDGKDYQPFNRNFCLHHSGRLYFAGKHVGKVNLEKPDRVTLKPKFEYLTELLEEAIGK